MKLKLTISLIIFTSFVFAQDGGNYWTRTTATDAARGTTVLARKEALPDNTIFSLDVTALKKLLAPSNFQSKNSEDKSIIVSLPNAEGTIEQYNIREDHILAPEIEAKNPDLKFYIGKGITDKTKTAFMSLTQFGLQVDLFKNDNPYESIEPQTKDLKSYNIFKVVKNNTDGKFICGTIEKKLDKSNIENQLSQRTSSRGQLFYYFLALAATEEYAEIILLNAPTDIKSDNKKSKEYVFATMIKQIENVNYVFQRDLGIYFKVVTDFESVNPVGQQYVKPDIGVLTLEGGDNLWGDMSQNYFDSLEVSGINYDLGFTFVKVPDGYSTAGKAVLKSICNKSDKGKAWAGISKIGQNTSFYKTIAHELGHVFDARHTFSYDFQNNDSQVESGLGVTIMGYNGKNTSTTSWGNDRLDSETNLNTFHAISIKQIQKTIFNSSCKNLGEYNNIPAPKANIKVSGMKTYEVSGKKSIDIPVNTPFVLKGDQNSNADHTYSWDQMDSRTNLESDYAELKNAEVAISTNKEGNLFESHEPSINNYVRYYPNSTGLGKYSISEDYFNVLPTVARELNFAFTVRNGDKLVPNLTINQITVNVIGTEGFSVKTPMIYKQTLNTITNVTSVNESEVPWNDSTAFVKGRKIKIRWEKANTYDSEISCKKVNILITSDEGVTFTTLADNVENYGSSANVIIPSNLDVGSAYRIKIEAADNIFYNYGSGTFKIVEDTSSPSEVVVGGKRKIGETSLKESLMMSNKEMISDESVISAKTTANSIELEWTQSIDNVGVVNYQILRKLSKDAPDDPNDIIKTIVITDNIDTEAIRKFTVTDLSENTNYFFKVFANDAAGNFSASNTLEISTKDTEKPQTPILVLKSSTDVSATLEFTNLKDNVGVKQVQIYKNGLLLDTFDYVASSPDTFSQTKTITGLNTSTGYDFYTIAVDKAGNQSIKSNTEYVGKYPISYSLNSDLDRITKVRLKANNGEENSGIDYSPAALNPNKSGYQYQDFTATGDSATMTLTKLNPNTLTITIPATYTSKQCKVWIDYNRDGLFNETPFFTSEITTSNTIYTQSDLLVPDTALNGVTRMRISLKSPVQKAYTYYEDEGDSGTFIPQTSFESNDKDFTNGIVQDYNVNIVKGDTEKPDPKPILTEVSKTGNTIDLSWTQSKDNVGVVNYQVTKKSNSTELDDVKNVVGTIEINNNDTDEIRKLTVTGLFEYTDYCFNVFANDAAGNFSKSEDKIIKTKDTKAPLTVNSVSVFSKTAYTAAAKWFFIDSIPGSGIKEYTVVVYRGNTQIGTKITTSLSFIAVGGLEPDTQYKFIVTAKDNENNTNFSEVSFTTSKADDKEREKEKDQPKINENVPPPTGPAETAAAAGVTGAAAFLAGLTAVVTTVATVTSIRTDENGNIIPDTNAPKTPTELSHFFTLGSDTEVNLWWKGPDDTDLSKFLIYQDGVLIGYRDQRWATITQLTSGRTYKFKVKAVDYSGNLSDFSNEVTVTMPDITPASAPKNLEFSGTNNSNIKLTWLSAADSKSVKWYNVYKNVSSNTAVDAKYIGRLDLENSTQNPGMQFSFPLYNISPEDKLTSFETCTFAVKAVDFSDNPSVFSNIVTQTIPDISPPSCPTNLSAKAETGRKVNLTWEPSTDNKPNVDNTPNVTYTISYNYGIETNNLVASKVEATSYTVTSVPDFSSVIYVVFAVDAAGNRSELSAKFEVTTLDETAPSIPENFKILENNNNSIKFQWDFSNDFNVQTGSIGSGVASYNIYGKKSTDSDFILLATVNSDFQTHTVSGLSNGNYKFYINAKDVQGNISNQSIPIDAVINVVTPVTPPKIINLKGVPEVGHKVNLSWGVETDNLSNINYSVLQYKKRPEITYQDEYYYAEIASGLTATDYVVLNVDDYTNIKFKLKARYGADGFGPESIISVQTKDETAPTKPIDLLVKYINETSVKLTWDFSLDDNGSGVKEYDIFIKKSTDTEFSFKQTSSTVGCSVNELTPNSGYDFYVKARDNQDNVSDPSEVSKYIPFDVTVPTAPSGLEAIALTNRKIDLSWKPSTDNSGNVTYTVFRESLPIEGGSNSLIELKTGIIGTKYQAIDLLEYTSYTFKVEAKDASNNKSLSDAINKTTLDETPPTTPTDFKVEKQNDTTVRLSWTASTDVNGSGIKNYEIERLLTSSDGTISKKSFYPLNTTSTYIIDNLTPGLGYDFRIRARDGDSNESSYTSFITSYFELTDNTLPSTPTNFHVGLVAGDIQNLPLLWYPSTDFEGKAVNRYEIFMKKTTDASYSLIKTISHVGIVEHFCSVSDLMTNVEYQFYIQAVDNANKTSVASSVITMVSVKYISNIKAVAKPGRKIDLTWTPTEDFRPDMMYYEVAILDHNYVSADGSIITKLISIANTTSPDSFEALNMPNNTNLEIRITLKSPNFNYFQVGVTHVKTLDEAVSSIQTTGTDVKVMKKTDVLLSTQSKANSGLLTAGFVNIYPNPVLDNLLNVEGIEDNVPYRIINKIGQKIRSGNLENGIITLDDLPAGLYNLVFEKSEGNITKRFIKK